MKKYMQDDNKYSMMLGGIVAIIILIVSVYSSVSQKRMEKYVHHAVEQNVESISDSVDAYISSALDSMKLISYLAAQNMTTSSIENSDKVLAPLKDQTPFDNINYVNQNGLDYTNQGEWVDVSDCEYYLEGIHGNSGIWVDYFPKDQEEYLFVFYTPLQDNGEITGVLTGTFCADTYILPLLETNFFGEDMRGILCDENGQVISSSLDTKRDASLEDILCLYEVKDKEKPYFYQHFEDADGSVFHLKVKSGEMLACINKDEHTGWRIVQIVPPGSVMSVMQQNTINMYLILAFMGVLFLLYLFYLITDSKKRHRKQLDEKDRVVKNYEQILTMTASETYKAVRRLDLETEQSDYIYFEDGQVHQVKLGSWREWFERQEKNVHPDDYERIKTIFDIDNIRMMEEGKTFQEIFRAATKNKDVYYNTYSTTVSITSIDGKKTALITIIDNTKAIMNDWKQKRWITSVANIYISMYALDLKNDTWEVLKTTEQIANEIGEGANDAEIRLKKAIPKLTDEQYQDAMLEFVDFQTLDERMKGVNTITFEFVGSNANWCRARFIAVDYDADHHLSHVLLVVENIDAVKRKANRLLYLSETDLMTEIRNRGSGEKKIRELVATNQAGMFCLLDVDKFKSINDNFGHSVGDKVLIEIAKCLKDSFRDTDIVMRLGGDEFAVYAKGVTTKELAKSSVERFFKKIDHIDISELKDHKISVSVGIILKMENDGLGFETLYHNADVCAYESKKITGNAYTIYE